jgi:hypothetical protein
MGQVESAVNRGANAVHAAAHDAARSRWVERLGRIGDVARGTLYIVVGALALFAAIGLGGEITDRKGALGVIAEQPFGSVLLGLVGLGLLGYAISQLLGAAVGVPGEENTALKRMGYALSGLIHGGLAVAAYRMLAGGSHEGGGNERAMTARVLAESWGPLAMGAIGAGIIAFGVHQLVQSYTATFREKLDLARMSQPEVRTATIVGRLGYGARGIVFGLVGSFVIKAAMSHDARQVRGLDGALLELARSPYGPVLLGTVAVGVAAYGGFCFFLSGKRIKM